jgi:hypothetical protein
MSEMRPALRLTFLVLPLFLLTISIATPVLANGGFSGADFTISPSSIHAGGTTTIVLTAAQASGFVAPPSGSSSTCAPGPTCSFTLQACPTGSFLYYSIHEIRVTSPSGGQYAIGSGLSGGTYDLSWPASIGGSRTTAQGLGAAINVTSADTLSVPFGLGTGVAFLLTTSIGDGTYAWFPVTGTNPTAIPTAAVGSYSVDIEGEVLCGESATPGNYTYLFFDVTTLSFTATDPTSVTALSCVAATVPVDGVAICTASVTDPSSKGAVAPTGTVTFASSGSGVFVGASCTLKAASSSSSKCSVLYSPAKGSEGTQDLTASYGGDGAHTRTQSTAFHLTVDKRSTKLKVAPGITTVSPGEKLTLTATVTDESGGIKTAPTLQVSWTDLGAGGTFSAPGCVLTTASSDSSSCTVQYTAGSSGKTAKIIAVYLGDTDHDASAGLSILIP